MARLTEANVALAREVVGRFPRSKSALITLFAKAKDKVGFAYRSVPEKPNLLATNHRFEVPPGINIRARYLHVVQSYFNDPVPFQEQAGSCGPIAVARTTPTPQ